MNKAYISADAYLRDIWRLAAEIRGSGWRPDRLIGLWRGGAPAAIAVHEFLRESGWNVLHAPLKCASYTGIAQNDGEVEFSGGEAVFGSIRRGERVLVVDDVFDTGKTAEAMHAKLDGIGAEMRLACVYWKSETNQTELSPDFFVRDVGSDWIVFPHEIDGLSGDEVVEKDPFLADLLGRFRQGGGAS